ncbi:hypothetical protein [Mangrovicoccus algicola]|uniref:YqaJ viral recombinase domain-containing protein n=1 Tax=Mangrovicoccus algicola TaxID=2771008 RepID=A0A8J6YTR8_9RHOB|nr:hypothetical protein [Mangrovicoccus algicola]MBE3637372.1 hypothetical protein [Mangrovicoccus algicola]
MDRNTYIGSSDARDILSGDWNRMYREKMGLQEREDLSKSWPVQLGLATEDAHLDWTIARLCEEHGAGFKHSKHKEDGTQHEAIFTPDGTFHRPVIGSHPDALIRTPDGLIYPMEAKHTGRWANPEEAADYYMPQLQHHMLALGSDMLLFSVIVGAAAPEYVWIGASKEWQDHYVERCDAFWGHIKSATPPSPRFFDGAVKPKPIVPASIKNTVPFNGMMRRDLSDNNQIPALVDEFVTTKLAAKRHEELKAELKEFVRDTDSEVTHPRITMKRNKRGAINITIHDEKKEAA